ncbi:YfhO family protein [Reichenbachiella versicolor]|uniref:YfhO family protein n=1 Tax=Reichenbachiella versicolor TaxID=1821036 RepID=UPI000D6DF44C|nr:YfhO family protein [Reichenbachiella versicolor]
MDLKKVLNHVLPVLLFIVVLSAYFAPVFFEGKHLKQNDVLQGIAAAQETRDYRAELGEEPLWSGTMFSGMPAYLISVHYSGDWMMHLNHFLRFLPNTVDAIFINFLCFYIMLLCFRVNPYLAFVGGLGYAFSTFTMVTAEAGHLFKVLAIGYLPLLFGGIKLVFTNRKVLGAALIAVGTGLELAAQHYQITFYGYLLAAIMTLTYMVREIKSVKLVVVNGAIVLFSVILGVGPSTGRLWGIQEYNPYTIRGEKELTPLPGQTSPKKGLDKDYAFAWSQGVWETMTMVIPNLYGGASGQELGKNSNTFKKLKAQNVPRGSIKQFCSSVPTYWGPQPFTSGPVYFGITILVLFILGLFTLPTADKQWLLIGTIFFTLLALGKNFATFNYFIFDYVPMFNKFRAVTMTLTITAFCMLLIGLFGLQNWLEKPKTEQFQILKKVALVSAGVIGGVWIFSLMFLSFKGERDASMQFPSWLMDAIVEDRKALFHRDSLRSLFFALTTLGSLFLFYLGKVKKTGLLGLIVLFSLLDLWFINKRYLNSNDFVRQKITDQISPSKIDLQIQNDKSNYRVLDLNNPFNNGITSAHHKSIGGYHGAKMQRYQDLIERHISKNNQKVLDILNCKYLITNQPQQPFIERETALGNAWFANNIIRVSTADEEIAELATFDQKNDAVVDVSKFKLSRNAISNAEASIKLDLYQPNYLVYSTNNDDNGFAVFSEIYYAEGWDAYIDGEKVPYLRADYILRGLEVPAGKHKVEFKFQPQSYFIGNRVSMGASILVVCLVLGAVFVEVKKQKEV